MVATKKVANTYILSGQRTAGNMIPTIPLSVLLPHFVCVIHLKFYTIPNLGLLFSI